MREASEVSQRAAEVRIAMHRDGDGPRYTYEAFAVSDAWEGTIKADNTESAIHEALCDCWRRRPKLSKRPVKVVVSVPFGKISPQYLPELEALHPGLSLTLHKGSVSDLVSDIPKSSVRKRWTTTEPNLAPVIVATDGSVRGGITGWGWLTSTGDFNMTGFRHSRDQMGQDIPLVAELRAIDDAIRGLSQHRSINIISDSRNAVTMVAEWMRGSTLLPAGYNADGRKKGKVAGLVAARNRIHRDRDRISISWAPGHVGEPLNEGADALARLASRRHMPGSDLTLAQYRRRAAEIAKSFSAAYTTAQEVADRATQDRQRNVEPVRPARNDSPHQTR